MAAILLHLSFVALFVLTISNGATLIPDGVRMMQAAPNSMTCALYLNHVLPGSDGFIRTTVCVDNESSQVDPLRSPYRSGLFRKHLRGRYPFRPLGFPNADAIRLAARMGLLAASRLRGRLRYSPYPFPIAEAPVGLITDPLPRTLDVNEGDRRNAIGEDYYFSNGFSYGADLGPYTVAHGSGFSFTPTPVAK